MQLNLNDADLEALKIAIDSYYSSLREEIYHTEDYDVRQTLKGIEASQERVRDQLEPGWLTRSGAGRDTAPTGPGVPPPAGAAPTAPPAT
jgi:Fic family protein